MLGLGLTITEMVAIIGVLGVPSLASIVMWLGKKLKANDEETQAVKLGVQALLRAQMVSDYNMWSEKGYAPIYARDNFENCWKNYEALGFNGVLDDIHKKFMALPTSTKNKETE